MIERFVPRLAWIAASFVGVGIGYLLFAGVWSYEPDAGLIDLINEIEFGLIPVSFAVTSAVILSRQPRNMVGWTLMVPAIGFTLASFVSTYLAGLSPAPTEATAWLIAVTAFENFSWVLLFFPVFHLLMVFPTGRLLSSKWRILVALETLMILTMGALATFAMDLGTEGGSWSVANPIGFISDDLFSGPFELVWNIGLVALAMSGILALGLRFRRADRLERQQIKWMFLAVTVFALVYSSSAVRSGFALGSWPDLLLGLSINALAVAIAFGVLKYRLFDIDRFISRTVAYAVVIGLLGSVYVAGAVWLPSQLAGNSPIFVAGSTLAVAALFNPLRRWVQKGVDRRFYRAKYDLDRIAEDFALRLRNGSEAAELTDDWMKVVSEALQPSASGVWVRF